MKILGLVFMRNAACYIQRCLDHLISHDIPVHVLDNESIDGSAEIARSYLNNGVVGVEILPYEGRYDLAQLLVRVQEITNNAEADWFLRCDVDEILEPPSPHRTLREGIQAAHDEGYNAINFDEFVFIPTEEDNAGHEGKDYVNSMRYYYFFEPKPNRLQRAWKRQPGGVDLLGSGGHVPRFPEKRLYPEPFVMRHYMVLSRNQALAKYGGRVYDVQAHLESGWHTNRIHFKPDKLSFPPRSRMKQVRRGEPWDKSDPKRVHEFLGDHPKPIQARRRLQAPSVAVSSEPPSPFIVGVGRSGTTLLRMMLDAHRDMAIPPETHVLPALAGLTDDSDDVRSHFVTTLTAAPTWQDLQLTESEIIRELDSIQPFDKTQAIRSVYRLYARRQRKHRWGDKTPLYNRHMLTIAGLIPEARFIHVIRDGRDVAVSARHLWFGPGDNLEAQAVNWMYSIRDSRQQAQNLNHYLEVRFEDLVRQPESTLRNVCEFVELPFDPLMLSYHERAQVRLDELAERRGEGGNVLASAEARRAIHANVTKPPDEGRTGRWKSRLSDSERRQFEEIAGHMLLELGY